MLTNGDTEMNLTNHAWNLYLDGWFMHKIYFSADGRVESNATDGFHRWEWVDEQIHVFDKQNNLSYTFQYHESAKAFINTGKFLYAFNNIILTTPLTRDELNVLFPNNPLAAEIANQFALFRSPKGEVWGTFFLGIDGVIYNYGHKNEKFWGVVDNKIEIYDENKQRSSVSKQIVREHNRLKLSVQQHRDNLTCYMDFIHDTAKERKKFVNIELGLGNRSDILLVTFSSRAGTYDGYGTRHELHSLPYKYGLDYIRVAQSAPTRWYLDDVERIKAAISIQSYQTVVMIGTSIGGYAALWFAEQLARMNPNTQYFSIAMQALSSLSNDFVEELDNQFSVGYRSTLPHNDIVQAYAHLETDIAKLLSCPVNNVKHYILFDQLNQAENLSSTRLVSERSILKGFDLGESHSGGSGTIGRSETFSAVLHEILQTSGIEVQDLN